MQRDDTNDNDKALRLIDKTLSSNKLETPSSNFTHRVMMNLHSIPVASALSPKNGILLLGGTLVAVMMLTLLLTTGMFDSVELRDVKTNIAVNGKWAMRGLILLNIVLAFLLFDRTILRPLFNKRALR